ncbi:type II secretion system F family protein [Streptomyces alkaliphilus]|uniref:type II secretion system F family protein n=1 Tax=Streptomyces alkaliphilus TaxID=1472722 RepID=UPI0011807DCA|nr:type II secretion system F family protein [Streptomyces alkaliphilus]MQS08209.1 type II secretion system protein [Streptomyces alkaliphilus]
MSGFLDPDFLAALAAGVAVGGGLALLIAAVRGFPPKSMEERERAERRRAELARFLGRRTMIAVLLSLLVLLFTRWPIAALATALLVYTWDRLFGGAAEERAAMRRVEALASWTESLRDTIAGAVGLEQAIPASARAAAPALREPLANLVDRLRSRMPLPDALQEFADELDDSSADIIIASLILNARLRGPGLREVLGALARSAREEVDMRQRVMAQRASTRRSVQIVVAVSVLFPLGLAIFNPSFVEPYGDPLGQAVLGVVCLLFGLGFWWMRSLAKIQVPERFMTGRAGAGRRGDPPAADRRAQQAPLPGLGRLPGRGSRSTVGKGTTTATAPTGDVGAGTGTGWRPSDGTPRSGGRDGRGARA